MPQLHTAPTRPQIPTMNSVILSLLLSSLSLAASAQPSPYAAETGRSIKALSADEVSQLLEGAGAGLARAAELNRHPGPRHALDLSAQLQLSPGQIQSLQEVFREMKSSAQSLGRALVDQEAELDRLFAARVATPDRINALTRSIGTLQGELRAVHLKAHVATAAILQPDQIARYDELRGYGSANSRPHGGAKRKNHP